MDLVKKMPTLPVLPQTIADAMPPALPPMDWESGFVKDFQYNWKLARMQKASERKAAISANNLQIAKNNIELMKSFMTASSQTELVFKEVRHKEKMMELEEAKTQAEASIVCTQAESDRIDLLIKKREYERLTNSEDR